MLHILANTVKDAKDLTFFSTANEEPPLTRAKTPSKLAMSWVIF